MVLKAVAGQFLKRGTLPRRMSVCVVQRGTFPSQVFLVHLSREALCALCALCYHIFFDVKKSKDVYVRIRFFQLFFDSYHRRGVRGPGVCTTS